METAFRNAESALNSLTSKADALSSRMGVTSKSLTQVRSDMDRISRLSQTLGDRIKGTSASFLGMQNNLTGIGKGTNSATTGIVNLGKGSSNTAQEMKKAADETRNYSGSLGEADNKTGFIVMKVVRLMLAYMALRMVMKGIKAEFVEGFKAVEDYQSRILQIASLMALSLKRHKREI